LREIRLTLKHPIFSQTRRIIPQLFNDLRPRVWHMYIFHLNKISAMTTTSPSRDGDVVVIALKHMIPVPYKAVQPHKNKNFDWSCIPTTLYPPMQAGLSQR